MKFKEPINCLKKELEFWKQEKTNIRNSTYQNDSSPGTDNMHRFYKKAFNDCDKMIKIYKEAIDKLKKSNS